MEPRILNEKEVLALIRENEGDEIKEKRAKVKALEADLDKAVEYIQAAISRHRKKMVKAKSKAEADTPDVFAALEGYESKEDIRTEYGFDGITLAKMEFLMDLWDMREESRARGSEIYTDRIIEMLELAIRALQSKYAEDIMEIRDLDRRQRQQAKEMARGYFMGGQYIGGPEPH